MDYLPQQLIGIKRDGFVLSFKEINAFISYIETGRMSDSQTAAMAMAIFLNGMNKDEIVALTLAMRDSGETLKWPTSDKPLIDKHSTGGVGDNVSLILAPLAASCGLNVPMISGRGLGHTGGTLDKLESIPNFNATPDIERFRETVKHAGCAIISQTENLAPADKKIYAIRDITATVESTPLIVASILSKKLAGGLEGLVLDVKCGNGATTSNPEEAENLAQILVDVACGAGLSTTALITDMNEPLASAVGNASEVENAVRFLSGDHRDVRLHHVITELVANMLVAGNVTSDFDGAKNLLQTNLDNGNAAEHFSKMVYYSGGPSDIVENIHAHLPKAPVIKDIIATKDGWISAYQSRDMGMTIVGLGGGRSHPLDRIDYGVGLTNLRAIATKVTAGEPIATAHVNSQEQFARLNQSYDRLVTIGDEKPDIINPVFKRVTASG